MKKLLVLVSMAVAGCATPQRGQHTACFEVAHNGTLPMCDHGEDASGDEEPEFAAAPFFVKGDE
jgi:hypothetical protein